METRGARALLDRLGEYLDHIRGLCQPPCPAPRGQSVRSRPVQRQRTTKSKSELLAELRPLPKEIWGRLHVTRFRTVRHDDTAIANYIAEEDEGYFGQVIHARYLTTDTWKHTAAGWRLVASQVLALRNDPPAIELPDGRLDEYVGTYALTDSVTYMIRREGHAHVGVRSGRAPETLKVELVDCLCVPGQPRCARCVSATPMDGSPDSSSAAKPGTSRGVVDHDDARFVVLRQVRRTRTTSVAAETLGRGSRDGYGRPAAALSRLRCDRATEGRRRYRRSAIRR